MDVLTRVPEPIQWSEGMPLAPQHFQQNDIYWQALLTHQMFQLEPHYWGVLDLKLDESALRAGRIVVSSLHAVMPDGLIVQYPASDERATLELDVSKDPELHAGKPLLVQLAVPVRAEGSASRVSSIQRFDSVPGTLDRDENTGDSPVPVGRLRVRLSLQSGERIPAKYVSLPLLQVTRDLGGQFDLTEYHPPLLRTGAAAFLGRGGLQHHLEELARLVRGKAKELSGVVGEGSAGIRNDYQLNVVRQLVAALPEFEIVARMPEIHPFRCYGALARLVGQVAGICAEPLPMLLPPYRHNDLAPGFFQAIRHVSEVVGKLSAAYSPVGFTLARDGVFTCELPRGIRTDRLIIEIKPRKGSGLQAAEQWLRHAYIGSSPTLPLLRERRMPGGRVKPLSAAQLTSLGAHNGAFYEIANQAIQDGDKLMPVIQKESVLTIEGPVTADAPAAIVLYVPTRQGSGEGGSNDTNGTSGANGTHGAGNGVGGGAGHG